MQPQNHHVGTYTLISGGSFGLGVVEPLSDTMSPPHVGSEFRTRGPFGDKAPLEFGEGEGSLSPYLSHRLVWGGFRFLLK